MHNYIIDFIHKWLTSMSQKSSVPLCINPNSPSYKTFVQYVSYIYRYINNNNNNFLKILDLKLLYLMSYLHHLIIGVLGKNDQIVPDIN